MSPIYPDLVHTKAVDSVFRALIGYSITEHLFTDSPPVSQSERRQTCVSCEQKRLSRFVAVLNKEISQVIKQAVPEIHEEGDEVRFGSFNR